MANSKSDDMDRIGNRNTPQGSTKPGSTSQGSTSPGQERDSMNRDTMNRERDFEEDEPFGDSSRSGGRGSNEGSE